MTAIQLFDLTGPLAMLGWLALVLSPLAPRVAQGVAIAVPLVCRVQVLVLDLLRF